MARRSGRGRGVREPAVLAWLRLARIGQKIDRAGAAHLRRFGLSAAQFDVLAQVGAAEGSTQQELAQQLLVTKGNVTQLLDRMEQCGLLERRQEGRAKRIFLTAAGRALRARVVPAHEQLIAEQFSALSREEQVQLLRLLGKVDRSLGAEAARETADARR